MRPFLEAFVGLFFTLLCAVILSGVLGLAYILIVEG